MKLRVKAGCGLAVIIGLAMAGWVAARGQTASAPATGPGVAAALEAILPDLASDDFARREAGQRVLEKVPAEQFEAVAALAAGQTDPEVKARLETRVAEMLQELRKSPSVSLRAVAMVAELLAMPSAAEDPDGKKNIERAQLAQDIGRLGDAALSPAQGGLVKAKSNLQRREMVVAIGAVRTPAGTQVLLGLLKEKDDVIRAEAILVLSERFAVPADMGGSDEILPALAKALPDEKDEQSRLQVCVLVSVVLKPIPPADKPDPRQVAQAVALLRERLKNDTEQDVRFYAACGLTEFGDNSGLEELKKAALAMQKAGLNNGFALDTLVPALERATGETFGPVPRNPTLSSDSRAVPGLQAARKALLEKVVAWAKAN